MIECEYHQLNDINHAVLLVQCNVYLIFLITVIIIIMIMSLQGIGSPLYYKELFLECNKMGKVITVLPSTISFLVLVAARKVPTL